MKMSFGPVSKAVAGAVSGMVLGSGTLAMTAEQSASMPWWGVILANAVYAGIGFATVYFAPANKPTK